MATLTVSNVSVSLGITENPITLSVGTYIGGTGDMNKSVYDTDNSGVVDAATTLTSLTSTVAELNKLDGYTGSVTELNYLDALHATGVTSTEFDYLDGVTSNIQTQFSGKASLSGATYTGLVAYDDTAFTTNIDCSLGNSFSKTVTANFTQTFSNVPATGNACVVVLKLYDAGDYTITWSTAIKWSSGTAPIFTSNGHDVVTLYTIDGGTNWYGSAQLGYA